VQTFAREGVSFAVFSIAAYFLAPDVFGEYNYVMAIAFLLIMFGDFGISTAMSRFAAEHANKEPDSLLAAFTGVVFGAAGVALGVGIFASIFGPLLWGTHYQYILLVLPLVLFVPLVALFDGLYRGQMRFRELTVVTTVAGLPVLLLSAPLIHYFGILGAFLAQDAYYLVLLVSFITRHPKWSFSIPPGVLRDLAWYSGVIGLTSLGFFVFSRVNVLILGHLNLIREIAVYEIANKLIAIMMMPFIIFSQVIAPRISRLASEARHSEIASGYARQVIGAAAIAAIVAGGIYLLAPFVVPILLPKYSLQELLPVVNIMLLAFVSQAASGVAASGYSTASGDAHLNMYWLFFFGAISLGAAAYSAENFGFMGLVMTAALVKIISDLTFIGYYYVHVSRRA
jgi:O-antigen/teichoic acid export membrane protein